MEGIPLHRRGPYKYGKTIRHISVDLFHSNYRLPTYLILLALTILSIKQKPNLSPIVSKKFNNRNIAICYLLYWLRNNGMSHIRILVVKNKICTNILGTHKEIDMIGERTAICIQCTLNK